MKKTILSLAAAGAVALGGIAAAPTQVQAAWWVAPVLIGSAVGVGAVGVASAANAQAYYAYGGPVVYEEPRARGVVYAAPSASCQWMRVQSADGRMIRQRVCDY